MTYQDTLDRLSTSTQDQAQTVLERLRSGEIDETTAEALLVSIILIAQRRGAAIADLSFTAQLTTMTATPVLPTGMGAGNSSAVKVQEVVKETMSSAKGIDDAVMRVTRIAGNEPQEIAKQVYGQAIAQDRRVEGWTRGLDADPCQLCIWWYRGGRVWPKDYPIQRHKGCTCTQVPAITDTTPAVPHSRILHR